MKTAIVTGASKGLGAALAEQLIEMGYHVVAPSRTPVKHMHAEWIQLDLADTEAVCDFIVTVNKKYDNVALLINNAAISPAARLINMSVLDFNKVIDVDFRVPQMIMSGMKKSLCDGTIINIVSRVGIEGRIGLSAYGAAKELLIDYTKVMASEYAQHNIRMFGVNPGFMITDMVSDKIAQIQKDKSLIKQCMTPALSAKLILDLWLNTSVCGSIVNLDSRIYNTWST